MNEGGRHTGYTLFPIKTAPGTAVRRSPACRIYSSKGVVVGERDSGKILVGHCRPSILSLTRLPTVRKQIPNRRLTAQIRQARQNIAQVFKLVKTMTMSTAHQRHQNTRRLAAARIAKE